MTSDLCSTFQYSGFSKALFKFDSRLYFNYEVFKCVFISFTLFACLTCSEKGVISCHVTAPAHYKAGDLATCTRCVEVFRFLTSARNCPLQDPRKAPKNAKHGSVSERGDTRRRLRGLPRPPGEFESPVAC